MKIITLLLTLTLIIGCISDAPRDNILDPKSGNFKISGNLNGIVTTYYQPFLPLANVFLRIDSLNISTQTDENGMYEISNIPAGEYILECFFYDYRADTAIIFINNDTYEQNFNLNALPTFESIIVNSHHVSRWFPAEDFYYLNVEVNINDLDGLNEIDSVKIDIPSIGFSDTLFSSGANGTYQQILHENQIPVQTIRSLEGIPMHFVCWDRVGNKTVSIDKFIPRIVQDVPVIVAPTGLQIVNTFPFEFSWQQVFLEYEFHFKIEIYQINIGIFSKIREYDNIMSNETMFMVNQALPAGDYFWTINIVDEFGDTSSGKEGTFIVQ